MQEAHTFFLRQLITLHMKRILTLALFFLGMLFISQSCQKAPFVTLNTPRSYSFTRDGGTQSITFTCNRDWSVSSSESWIQVSPSSGSASDGEITVKITCAANTTYDPRSATLTVKVEDLSEAISISQDTGIGLIVSPKTFELSIAEQTIEIEVQKNVQYSISIDEAGKDWITHTGTKGLTSEKATFSIAANEKYDNREGKITFKQNNGSLSETVVVKQAPAPAILISQTEYQISADYQTLSIKVESNVQYELTLDSGSYWYRVVDSKSLSPSYINLAFDANDTFNERIGRIAVKQKDGDVAVYLKITQAGMDKFVDLGLSVYWGTCNLGADRVDGYGDYYAWGEVVPNKEFYGWETYVHCDGNMWALTKYNTFANYGIVDNITVLEPEDDAATVSLGGPWRMPTKDEMGELYNNCSWTYSRVGNSNGYLVVSKVEGYEGKSIFLPCSGYRFGKRHDFPGEYGHYWTSSLHIDTSAICLAFRREEVYPFYNPYIENEMYYLDRWFGNSIRPVYPKE